MWVPASMRCTDMDLKMWGKAWFHPNLNSTSLQLHPNSNLIKMSLPQPHVVGSDLEQEAMPMLHTS